MSENHSLYIVTLLAVCGVDKVPDLPWTPQSPYIIYGYVRLNNSDSVSLTATNKNTGETQSITSETDSSYLIDCANFSSGYTNLDTIELSINNNKSRTTINTSLFPEGRRFDIYQTKKFGHSQSRVSM